MSSVTYLINKFFFSKIGHYFPDNLITSVIQNIHPDELERVFQNTQRRARLCLQVNGAHFQQLL